LFVLGRTRFGLGEGIAGFSLSLTLAVLVLSRSAIARSSGRGDPSSDDNEEETLLRLLSQTRTHPTADELVRRIRRRLPSVSHATFYRNLKDVGYAIDRARSHIRSTPALAIV
jgi:hypothetical protein